VLAAPAIEFAENSGRHLAYQVAGTGPPDLVFVGGSFATTLAWDEHAPARGFRRLASFSRLITYDQIGMGYSDPIEH
jgi:pimeloyl-ACP methyl ester carboxylesterase